MCSSDLVNLIQVEDMRKETYRFVSLSLAANGSTNPTPTGDGFTKYVMPEAGHIISVNVYTSAAIISGQWDIALFINGSSPTYPPTSTLLSTTSPFETRIAPYLTKFAKGDVLTVYTHASGSWNPTNDLCVEVTVSLGPDGTLLA